jgi:hypothetical protein
MATLDLHPIRQAQQLGRVGTSASTIVAHLQMRFGLAYADAMAALATARTLERHGLEVAPR